jgi:hypothetical protein
MRVGEYEIPPDWESMSCIYNCGYVLVWERGKSFSSGSQMDEHLLIHHSGPQSFFDWFKFWRKD